MISVLCQHAQAGVRRRDEEIARLAARLEAAQPGNTEALELRARQQAETIVQLHGQLEEATLHVQTLTATAERVKAAEAAAQQAVAAQKVCFRTTMKCSDPLEAATGCVNPDISSMVHRLLVWKSKNTRVRNCRQPSTRLRRRWQTTRPSPRRWSKSAMRSHSCRKNTTRLLLHGGMPALR